MSTLKGWHNEVAHAMPQSLARNVIHLIFSTKHRQPFITPPVRDKLFAYLAGTLNKLRCPALASAAWPTTFTSCSSCRKP